MRTSRLVSVRHGEARAAEEGDAAQIEDQLVRPPRGGVGELGAQVLDLTEFQVAADLHHHPAEVVIVHPM